MDSVKVRICSYVFLLCYMCIYVHSCVCINIIACDYTIFCQPVIMIFMTLNIKVKDICCFTVILIMYLETNFDQGIHVYV